MDVIVDNNIAWYGNLVNNTELLSNSSVLRVKVTNELLPFTEKCFTCEGGVVRVHVPCNFTVNERNFQDMCMIVTSNGYTLHICSTGIYIIGRSASLMPPPPPVQNMFMQFQEKLTK